MSLDSIYKLSVIVSMVDSLSGPAAKIAGVSEKTIAKLDNMTKSATELTKTGTGDIKDVVLE